MNDIVTHEIDEARNGVDEELVLRFDHGIIEHLGLRLYQNRPTNVIAELISNSWDAESKNVWIEAHQDGSSPWFAVADDGKGMSREELRDRYLVIGLPKRKDPTETSEHGRYLMGRKGIGKLAPFGIAKQIDVVSVSSANGVGLSINWIRIDVDQVAHSNSGEYSPDILAKNATVIEVKGIQDDISSQVIQFLDKINNTTKTGTLVLMRNLTLKRVLPPDHIITSLGTRFTVTLLRDDFKVHVNSTLINEKVALPEFFHRIPRNGVTEETLSNGKTVKYWVGFVKSAAWASDQGGVGVYAHGKIAQDRPFVFSLKGREIYTRYLYGVVEADWLDELPEDIISTDRTSIDWENPDATPLHEWGEAQLRAWIEEYRKKRAETERDEVLVAIKESMDEQKIPKFRDWETNQIAEMVAHVTPSLPSGEEGRRASNELIKTVADAWSHRPARVVIKKLWERISDPSLSDGDTFSKTISDLHEHSIPEFLSLGVTFSQRAYALSLMWDMIHKGREMDLQYLIEKFPWIIEPEDQLLTANQQLKTVIDEYAKATHDPYLGRDVRAMLEERENLSIQKALKPDFVFLTDTERKNILVVELKNPQNPLIQSNYKQLQDYIAVIVDKYPESECRGILIGKKVTHLHATDTSIRVRDWQEQFNISRRAYVDMLAAMIKTADPDPEDSRLGLMKEFGGENVWKLLENVAKSDDDLKILISDFEKKYPLRITKTNESDKK